MFVVSPHFYCTQVTAEAIQKKVAGLESAWRARLALRARRWGVPAAAGSADPAVGTGSGGLSERVLGVLLKFLKVSVDAVHVQVLF